MGPAIIRRARPADLDALLALYHELAATRSAAAPGDHASARPVLEQILADPARHLIVGIVDGHVVGTADLLIVANLTHRGKPWAIVENVVVAAATRRSGVGGELMRHLIELAGAAGCYKVQLLSGKQRAGAHALYRNLGLDAVAEGFKIYLDA
jgi:ribosomal protein S18 acetylase RimI-like enzyme